MYVLYQMDALAAGADGFLVKGYPIEMLLQAAGNQPTPSNVLHTQKHGARIEWEVVWKATAGGQTIPIQPNFRPGGGRES
jgi:hypothetical protein